MEEENVQAQEEVVEQEEQTSEEIVEEASSLEEESDTVTLTKAELKKLQRKAIAYDATKKKPLQEKSLQDNLQVNYLTREEGILIAKGFDDEAIELSLGACNAVVFACQPLLPGQALGQVVGQIGHHKITRAHQRRLHGQLPTIGQTLHRRHCVATEQ